MFIARRITNYFSLHRSEMFIFGGRTDIPLLQSGVEYALIPL